MRDGDRKRVMERERERHTICFFFFQHFYRAEPDPNDGFLVPSLTNQSSHQQGFNLSCRNYWELDLRGSAHSLRLLSVKMIGTVGIQNIIIFYGILWLIIWKYKTIIIMKMLFHKKRYDLWCEYLMNSRKPHGHCNINTWKNDAIKWSKKKYIYI